MRADCEECAGHASIECETPEHVEAHLDYFAPSLIDDSVRELLAPYMAQKVA